MLEITSSVDSGEEDHLTSQCLSYVNTILSNDDYDYDEELVDEEFEKETKDAEKELVDATGGRWY